LQSAICKLRVPEKATVFGVNRYKVRVNGPHNQRIAKNGKAAVHQAAAQAHSERGVILIDPEQPACFCIEGNDVIRRLCDIHNPVDNDRSCLELLQRLSLKDPTKIELLDIRRGDLIESAVSLARIISGIGQPILRFPGCVKETLIRYLAEQAAAGQKTEK
jgi:hypothetical protein